MTTQSQPAGGRATLSGMEFEARVAAWFAAHLLAEIPIGTVFGMPADSRVTRMQCETTDPVDDVVARLSDGGMVYVQCKTTAGLTRAPDSPLASTVEQIVRLHIRSKQSSSSDPAYVAILAVTESAPRSLDDLEDACRMFDLGGSWRDVLASLPDARRVPLALFESHIRAAWPDSGVAAVSDEDLATIARNFRILRFPDSSSDPDWRSLAQALGRRVYGGDDAGEAPMEALMDLGRRAIQNGAPMERDGVLRVVRAAGYADVAAPAFDSDIAALLSYSREERQRLKKHTVLPIEGATPIQRDCLQPLQAAAEQGSLLVTGEPGAGKTGVLLRLADILDQGPGPVIFLSVERFSGFTKRSDFRADLSLKHDPIEVLAAWPGVDRGTIIIDALDASRGGKSESVVASLIADAVSKVGDRWSVVASIRSFDLRNGRRFRELMRGHPPDSRFVESNLDDVRHFQVPRLSPEELAALAADAPKLRDLEATAPFRMRDLLRNIFNLSLAAELLAADVDVADIKRLATQSELIDAYEDIRLKTHSMRIAVKLTVKSMVKSRRLIVPDVSVEHDELDAVLASGVLVRVGRDAVAFAHHVLFDHVAGRYFFDASDPASMRGLLSGDPTIGLLLGPALRFALERMWHDDDEGRPRTWEFLVQLALEAEPDPIVLSTALRTAAEQVEVPADIEGLLSASRAHAGKPVVGKLLGQLTRYAGLVAAQHRGERMSAAKSLAWALVAEFAARQDDLRVIDAARILLMALDEAGDLADQAVGRAYGAAARAMLGATWAGNFNSVPLAANAIRFVTRSYGSDPDASRALLERILEERFESNASTEAPWLARGVADIFPHDPDFVVRIYETLHGRDVDDDGKTWVGGTASRILPMTSNHRQDYQHGRWQLNHTLPALLEANTAAATRAVIGAVRGMNEERRSDRGQSAPEVTEFILDGRAVRVIDDLLSFQDWRDRENRDKDVLTTLVAFLRRCSLESFRTVVNATLPETANVAVWARILGVAAERLGTADDLLWPLVSVPQFLALQGVARDAVIFIAAVYPSRTAEQLEAFETRLLVAPPAAEEKAAQRWRYMLARYLSSVPEAQLATDGMRTMRAELDAAGDLTGNRPGMTMTFGWGEDESLVDRMLTRGGAKLEQSPDREIRAASRLVEDAVSATNKDSDTATLARLWVQVIDLVRILDGPRDLEPHSQLLHASWGAVCNGVERVASGANYEPGAEGLPSLDELIGLIDRLSTSVYPEPKDTEDTRMGWGNWDVRVYAARSVMELAPRFGDTRRDLIERLPRFLVDPAPTVRHQVSSALNVLWDVARDRMWELATRVAESEEHPGVLAFFISGPLWPMAHGQSDRVASLLSTMVERAWGKGESESEAKEPSERDQFADAAGSLVAFLYVARDRQEAWTWIEKWSGDIRRGGPYIGSMLHGLRDAIFLAYRETPKPDESAMAARALRLIHRVADAAAAGVAEARPHVVGATSEEESALWLPKYIAADRVLDSACNQLYFGSGAFRTQNDTDPIGLPTLEAKRQFVLDYAPVLDLLDGHASAQTVHNLVGLYGFLADGNPEAVFDRVAGLLLGAGAKDGYHFESLGSDALVALVRRYLADHRSIFSDKDRRERLIRVLELFSSAGWPEALRLMFELPDLMR